MNRICCKWNQSKAQEPLFVLFRFFSLSLLTVLSRIILSNYYKHLSRERSALCFITKWMMTLSSAICHGSYYIIRNFIQVGQDPSNQAPSRVKCEMLKARYRTTILSALKYTMSTLIAGGVKHGVHCEFCFLLFRGSLNQTKRILFLKVKIFLSSSGRLMFILQSMWE